MRRRWILFGTIAVTSGAALAAACGGDEATTGSPGDQDATTSDAGPAFDARFDAPSDFPDVSEVTCVEPGVATISGATEFRAHQNRCATGDIATFVAVCFEGSDAGSCAAFVGAHADCAACLVGASSAIVADAATPDAAPTWPAIDAPTIDDAVVNIDGCFAAAVDAGDECGLSASARQRCVDTACAACDGTDFAACETYVTTFDDSTTCVRVAPPPGCLDAVDAAAKAANPSCIPADGGGFVDYARLAGEVLCGP